MRSTLQLTRLLVVACSSALLAGCVLGEPGDGPDPYRFGTAINIDGGINTSHEIVVDARDLSPTADPPKEEERVTRQRVGLFSFGFSLPDAESVPDEYCLKGDFEVYEIGPPRELVAFLPAGTCLEDGGVILAPPPE